MMKLFPPMTDRPEGKQIAMGGLYWVVYQIVLPFIMMLIIAGCAVGFAAPAQERPWMGYLVVALITAIPMVLVYTSGAGDLADAAVRYFAMLPLHMCACWVYQRSDTIWGPIIFQALANLVSLPIAWGLMHMTYVYHGPI